MASSPNSPNNAPTIQFIVVPLNAAGQLELERAHPVTSQSDATNFAKEKAKGSEHPVIIFQAISVMAEVKKVDVLWTPRGAQ